MSSNMKKYIGLDVHQESIAIAVLNSAGKLVMESIVETKAATLLEFLHGLRGELHVTLEEGTWAACTQGRQVRAWDCERSNCWAGTTGRRNGPESSQVILKRRCSNVFFINRFR